MLVSLENAKLYLRVDSKDEDDHITKLITVAEKWSKILDALILASAKKTQN